LQGEDPAQRVADMAISKVRYAGPHSNNGPFYYDVDSAMALSVCRSYNNSLGRIIKKFPGKFFGLVTLPIASSRARGARA
jgi:hypothetical protein